jgi:flavin-dependent dehydrogenase
MKTNPWVCAAALCAAFFASAALAQDYPLRSREDLGPKARAQYDRCVESATNKPTPTGIHIALRVCDENFLMGQAASAGPRLSAEARARRLAEEYNAESASRRDGRILTTSATHAGRHVTVKFLVSPEGVRPDFEAVVERELLGKLCRDPHVAPDLQAGVRMSYIYDDTSMRRLANVVVSQARCGEWPWNRM